MNLPVISICFLGSAATLCTASLSAPAQVRTRARSHSSVTANSSSNSASHVGAELVDGTLNPVRSKPGDAITVRLQDNIRSNGELILRKGSTLTGIVRNVTRSEDQSQSIVQIEWLVPAFEDKRAPELSIALKSVTQVNPIDRIEHERAVPTTTESLAVNSWAPVNTRSNTALLKMPSVVAVDQQSIADIEKSLGAESPSQLFKVGQGTLITSGGSKQSVDLFSHLSNDTVITSQSKDFEISSGAQMQLLVGVNRR